MARVPDDLAPAEAAPLLCAGITTYNALRHSGARPGDVAAVQGVGGLGHLGIQYARRMGLHVVAVSRGSDKRALALELGAHRYLDADSDDVVAELTAMGGARVILCTAPSAQAASALVDGLGRNGQLILVGASMEPLAVAPLQLIAGRRSILGWPCGDAKGSEDTMNFSALAGIRPRIETFSLEQAGEAYQRMMDNKARFRAVLVMS